MGRDFRVCKPDGWVVLTREIGMQDQRHTDISVRPLNLPLLTCPKLLFLLRLANTTTRGDPAFRVVAKDQEGLGLQAFFAHSTGITRPLEGENAKHEGYWLTV